MNGRDVDDVLQLLAEQRAASNHSIQTYQRKLLFRLRTQLVSRAPVAEAVSGPIEEFEAFARWLEGKELLENTYATEAEGGQPRLRTLQMTADAVAQLQSDQLRSVVFDKNHTWRLEEWHEWALIELESQLNRWRHLPAAALPVLIRVEATPLRVEPAYKKLIEPRGDTTLRFSVVENANKLF